MKPRMGSVAALLVLLCAPPVASAVSVIVDGKEWRQLTETVGFIWNEVATACNVTTGVCSGTIDGVSVDGWTWASISEVQSLFDFLIDPTSVQFPDLTSSVWGHADIAAALSPPFFTPTVQTASENSLWGLTRTLEEGNCPTGDGDVWVARLIHELASGIPDLAGFSTATDCRDRVIGMGIWLYRSTSVPEPGTLALLGLAGLGLSRRRKAN